jgi:hypothetical protein
MNASSAIAAAGVNDGSIADQLRFYLGSTIKIYIDKARVGLIAHRVSETSMSVPDAGKSAGILCSRTLRDTFKRCTGERPTDLQQPSVEPELTCDTWLRAGLGDFDAVRETIGALRPFVPVVSKEPTIAIENFERWYSERVIWPNLRELSLEEGRKEVQHAAVVGMALVNLLRQKSRQEGRLDRQRGIELAKLARIAVLNVKLLSRDVLKEEIAMGWAWVGNALRLALDFVGAEDAFQKAFETLARREVEGPSIIVGDIYYLKVSLQIYRRQHEKAIELAELSLKNFQAMGDRVGEIKALEIRAVARDYAGMPEAALADLMKIVALQPDDDIFAFRAYYSMAIIYEKEGEYERAAELLGCAMKSSAEKSPWIHHFPWIKATIHHGLREFNLAEVGYREAVEGFAALDETFYSRLASLDLSILYLDLGRYLEAIDLSSVVVSFFTVLDLSEEALAALQVLKQSLCELSLTKETLLGFRDAVRQDPTLPASRKPGPA